MDKIIKLLQTFDDNPVGNEFLDSRYNPNSRYYRFFFQLTKMLKPKVLVELGSWQGTSAAYFAGGNKGTKVITVDHHTDPGDEENKRLTLNAESAFDNSVGTYPIPIAFLVEGDIVPEVTIPISFPSASTIG